MNTPIKRHHSATKDVASGTPNRVAPTVEEIRQRAYQIFLARGGRPGNELEDWLRAEQELKQPRATRES